MTKVPTNRRYQLKTAEGLLKKVTHIINRGKSLDGRQLSYGARKYDTGSGGTCIIGALMNRRQTAFLKRNSKNDEVIDRVREDFPTLLEDICQDSRSWSHIVNLQYIFDSYSDEDTCKRIMLGYCKANA